MEFQKVKATYFADKAGLPIHVLEDGLILYPMPSSDGPHARPVYRSKDRIRELESYEHTKNVWVPIFEQFEKFISEQKESPESEHTI
jgi:hypothetical protein